MQALSTLSDGMSTLTRWTRRRHYRDSLHSTTVCPPAAQAPDQLYTAVHTSSGLRTLMTEATSSEKTTI